MRPVTRAHSELQCKTHIARGSTHGGRDRWAIVADYALFANHRPETCAICERTLLLGERTTRFAPEGEDFLDVCPLCHEIAAEHGLGQGGQPDDADFEEEPRRKLQPRRVSRPAPRDPDDSLAPEPILRRLSDQERAMVEAAELFNASPYRRTVGGIGKSLGEPTRASSCSRA